jgi:hypothetical protein
MSKFKCSCCPTRLMALSSYILLLFCALPDAFLFIYPGLNKTAIAVDQWSKNFIANLNSIEILPPRVRYK